MFTRQLNWGYRAGFENKPLKKAPVKRWARVRDNNCGRRLLGAVRGIAQSPLDTLDQLHIELG